MFGRMMHNARMFWTCLCESPCCQHLPNSSRHLGPIAVVLPRRTCNTAGHVPLQLDATGAPAPMMSPDHHTRSDDGLPHPYTCYMHAIPDQVFGNVPWHRERALQAIHCRQLRIRWKPHQGQALTHCQPAAQSRNPLHCPMTAQRGNAEPWPS